MIDTISIRNFQSLAHIDLTLAPLTVIVGPSSSGKSAFIRALRTLVANRRGTDFITHGEHTSSISAHLASRDPLRSGTVTLTRSSRTAPNSYVLIPDDPSHPLHPRAEFTKLDSQVPAQISDFLGIPVEQIDLAVASQFDKPYLLADPGTSVARTLGALTNAHIILGGARESQRQKLDGSKTLRLRSADLEAIRVRVPEFKALAQQRASLDRADALIDDARALADSVTRLTTLTETAEIATARIPALRTALASIPDPIDIDALVSGYQEAQRELGRYRDALRAVQVAQRAAQSAREALSSATEEHQSAIDALRTSMQGIAAAFESYFREHAKTLISGDDTVSAGAPDYLSITEASKLAARYVAQLDG